MSNQKTFTQTEISPLASLDEWEEDVLKRYPEQESAAKTKEEFRNYETPGRDTVREFYRLNHTYQTYDFVQQKRAEFLGFDKKEMSVWEAFDLVHQLGDDIVLDTHHDQLQPLVATSGPARVDELPGSMVVA